MRQKYTICREQDKRRLSIKEYAILERTSKNPITRMIEEAPFSLLGEEIYDSAMIATSIERGREALVRVLRTKSLFPIGPHMARIAESVVDLYALDKSHCVDLFFDDIQQLEQRPAGA